VRDDDSSDIEALQFDSASLATPHVPAKIRKRREQFAMLPMWWVEKLAETPLATGATWLVACHLVHLHWKNHGKPFKLPNGMLRYDGISRQSKWRALVDLERRGLIAIERRPSRSPIVRIVLAGGVSQP
jgi:hypothetical protein